METRGFLAPETPSDAADTFESLGPVAQVVTKEVARAMAFDRDEYNDRVTEDVVQTAREALFASLLEVHVGSASEFDSWLDERDGLEVHLEGNENVDQRAWHPVYPDDTVAAVTFHDEADAAVATVKRQAFGRFYRELLGRE